MPELWRKSDNGCLVDMHRLTTSFCPDQSSAWRHTLRTAGNAACGDYRVVHWGRLSYAVDCADAAGSCEFSVSHAEGSGFHFWLKAAKGHTLCSVSVRFHKLDEIPHSYVQSYRRSNVTQIYGGGAG